jgi:hypothetical protein
MIRLMHAHQAEVRDRDRTLAILSRRFARGGEAGFVFSPSNVPRTEAGRRSCAS